MPIRRFLGVEICRNFSSLHHAHKKYDRSDPVSFFFSFSIVRLEFLAQGQIVSYEYYKGVLGYEKDITKRDNGCE